MKTIYIKPILLMTAILLANLNYGAHIVVPPATCYLVGTSAPYNTLGGGDTLFFASGNKAYIELLNFHGNSTSPLVIMNQGGTVFIGKHFNYGIKIGGCRYLKLTGTGSVATYGFQVTQSNGDGVAIGDLSSDISVDHISADSCDRGISAKTDPGCNGYAWRNNFTQYNTILHDCLITHTTSEGMYIGNSFYAQGEVTFCNGKDTTILPSLLNNCQIYNNIVKYTGYDGIQVACVTVGLSIHDNLVMFDSRASDPGQIWGILIGGGSKGDCYNNYIYDGKGSSIGFLGLGASKIYNNVIVNSGLGYYPGNQNYPVDAIYVNDNTMLPGAEVDIMFNTIINPKSYGIDFESHNASASAIASNCIINPGHTGVGINNGGSSSITITNNYNNANIAPAMFADTTYKTLPGSPLIDAGWSNGKGITADKFGNTRPQGVTYDIGVYEFSGNTNNPTVTTNPVTNITQTTATSGGVVTSIGGSAVTARGVCWNTTPNPVATGNHTSDGAGLGSFVSNITGLASGILYYVRAYATNSTGTSYGNEVTFTTLSQSTLATVTTNSVTNIKSTTATCGGNVTSDGGASVTARGVCWNTSPTPTISNPHTINGSGTGNFTSFITGLRRHTNYYVRAYATNIHGTAYGNQQVFTTLRSSQNDEETPDPVISNIGRSTLELYPDPAISTLTVSFYLAEKSNINLSIHDICGMNIYQEQLKDQPSGPQKMQLNISSLKEGIYIVTVTTDKMVNTRKFIKID
jgi:hypothetical protein